MVDINIDEINKKISNPTKKFASLKGLEIIAENLVYEIYDLFGRNALLSMLYQIGKGTSEIITKRIKEKYKRDVFELEEAFQILLEELKDFYSVQIRDVEMSKDKIRMIIENRCFLRDPIKDRERLKLGKAFCRINKGYFEAAFTDLTKIKKVDINFLESDEDKDVCIEELVFYLND